MSDAWIAVCDSPGTVDVRSQPVPPTSAGDGLLRIEASGICGTDVAIFEGRLAADRFPVSLGHEIAGTIDSLGDEAADSWGVAPGDRVFVQEFLPCGRCPRCRQGQYALCPRTDFITQSTALRYGATSVAVAPSLWGGFGEMLYLHPSSLVHRLPDGIPAELATLLVPLGNGVDWVTLAGRAAPGESVAIFGPGQHGLGCVVAALEAGTGRVTVIGTADDTSRLAVARALGAHEVHALSSEEERAEVLDTDAFDLVVDTSGAPTLLSTLTRVARPLGRIVLAAAAPGSLDAATLSRKALSVIGVRGRRPGAVDQAIDVLNTHQERLRALCSHTYGLTAVAEALATARAGAREGAIHVSVVP